MDQKVATAANVVARLERLPPLAWRVRMSTIVGSATLSDAFDALTIAFVAPGAHRRMALEASSSRTPYLRRGFSARRWVVWHSVGRRSGAARAGASAYLGGRGHLPGQPRLCRGVEFRFAPCVCLRCRHRLRLAHWLS